MSKLSKFTHLKRCSRGILHPPPRIGQSMARFRIDRSHGMVPASCAERLGCKAATKMTTYEMYGWIMTASWRWLRNYELGWNKACNMTFFSWFLNYKSFPSTWQPLIGGWNAAPLGPKTFQNGPIIWPVWKGRRIARITWSTAISAIAYSIHGSSIEGYDVLLLFLIIQNG